MNGTDEITELAKKRTVLAVDRNKLANERTFLSWIRTGLACVGGGVAIIRFLTFQYETHKLIAKGIGEVLILAGIAIFIFALKDYKDNYKKLDAQAPFPLSLWLGACLVIVLSVLSTLLLLIT